MEVKLTGQRYRGYMEEKPNNSALVFSTQEAKATVQ